jgi:hemolysin activation/secretion protein
MLSFVSPLSSAHKMNVSVSKSYEPHELKLLQTGYTIPVGTSGAKVTLDTMISRSQPSSANFGSNLQIYGSENRMGASASVPVLRGRYYNLYGNLDFTSRNVESTSSLNLTDTMDRIRKVSTGFVLDFSDVLQGMNIIRVDGVHGLPVFGATRKEQGNKSRPTGDPRFYLVNFFASREQHIFGPFSLYGLAHGQVSFSPLLSAERFRGGGMPYNKAYPNSAITGDSGVEEKLEFRYTKPMENFLKHYMVYFYASQIQIWNRTEEVAEKKKGKANAIGIGGRATFQSGPTLELEYGRPTTATVNNQRYKSKILMGFTYAMNNG